MKRHKYRFGISSWSYPWSIGVARGPQPARKMSPINLMEKAVEYGAKIVQIADNLPLEGLSEYEIDQIADFAEAHQIGIETGTKGVEETHLLQFLKLASRLGSPIVRTLPALFGKKADMREVEHNIRRVLPEFEKEGITIVLENTEAFKADEYASLMERIDHPQFRMCVDLANALGAMEGPEYILETLIPYCGNFHFKDIVVNRSETLMGFTVGGAPSGKGQLSLTRILEALRAHHLIPSIIIELWPPFVKNIEETMQLEDRWVKESVAYMKAMLD